MGSLIAFLQGNKTYLLTFLTLIYAIAGYFSGHLTSQDAMKTAEFALIGAGLRHGITTEAQKNVSVIATLANPEASRHATAVAIQTAQLTAPTSAEVANATVGKS